MQSNRCTSSVSSAVLSHAITGMKTGDFEDTMEHLCAMRKQEVEHYPVCPNYLHLSSPIPPGQVSERVNEGWRRKICEWSYEVVDHFNFVREVVSVALHYLDLVVSIKTQASGTAILRRDFQLIAVTSLYVAIKLHGESDTTEGPRRKLKISAFVDLSRGLFQVETLESEERNMLNTLKWHVNPPTAVRFVATYLRLLPHWSNFDRTPVHPNVSQSIFELSRYLTELSVCVSAFTFRFSSSCIAYAAILAAMDALHDTVSLSYDVRVEFLSNIASCTNMTPQLEEVRQCKTMLIELCPTMFDHNAREVEIGLTRSVSNMSEYETIPSPSARTSPVCVVDELKQDLSPGKRRRISES